MKRLLITGFDPFNGQSINPSWEAVKSLPDRIGGTALTKIEIPTVYGKGAEAVLAAADGLDPDFIICVGQAGGRAAVTPEAIAINLREASIADNVGNKFENAPVIEGAPAAYFSTLPVREMVKAIKEAGIPAALSYSAGAFVCNDTLYTLLHRYNGTDTRVCFIHVPYMAGQGEPSLTKEQITAALTAAIEVI